jgi:hypothetical protein
MSDKESQILLEGGCERLHHMKGLEGSREGKGENACALLHTA